MYIFVNGGALSHYNSEEKDSYGEDIFIKELIPHIDSSYRTINKKSARGLEGFSQGGRAATRYMFKYPELFGTISAGGGSYMVEKLIRSNNGFEDDPRDDSQEIHYVGKGNDAWSLAEEYTKLNTYIPKLLLWSGDLDPNLLSINDIIVEVQKTPIKKSSDLNKIVQDIFKKGEKTLLLTIINSNNQRRYLGVKIN